MRLASLVAMGLLLAGGCGSRSRPIDSDRLLEIVPALRPDLARHLTEDDEDSFRTFCSDRLGAEDLLDAVVSFYRAIFEAPGTRARATREELAPLFRRLTDLLAHEYGITRPGMMRRALRELDDAGFARIRAFDKRRHAILGADMDRAARVDSLLGLAPEAKRLEPLRSRAVNYADLAGVVAGDSESARRFLHLAIWHWRRGDHVTSVARAWANMADLHWLRTDVDSTWIYLDRARELATQHGLATLAGRTYEFEGAYRSDLRQLHLANQAFMKAEETCDLLGGRHRTLRFVLRLAEFHTDMGLWDLVITDLERSEALMSIVPLPPGHQFLRWWQIRRDLLRGRGFVATGRVEEGLALLEGVSSLIKQAERQHGSGRVLWARQLRWRADALCELERWAEALEIARAAEEHCLKTSVHELAPIAEILIARASFALGDRSEAHRSLASFQRLAENRPEPFAAEWVQHGCLTVELARAEGADTAAADALERALTRLAADLRRMEASAEAYVLFEQARPLKDLAHRILREHPEAGYAFEVLWAQAPQEMGLRVARAPGESPRDAPESSLHTCAQIVRSHLLGTGTDPLATLADLTRQLERARAEHWLYTPTGDRLVRWVRTNDRVERAELAVPADAVRRAVEMAARTATEPETGDDELVRHLTFLGSSLLPQERLQTWRARPRVFIGVTGSMANLPLGALNTSHDPREYAPLRSLCDVFRLRYRKPHETASRAVRSLVVANPNVASTSHLASESFPPLPHAEAEARAVRARWANPLLLVGADAQKARVLAEWEQAAGIYFAVHHSRDPRLPYRSLLPLSIPAHEKVSPLDAIERTCLQVHDVRAADLTSCELVVLAACASGQRYVDSKVSGPSLSEAFIDAGAHVVVQTSWPLRDDNAAAVVASGLGSLPEKFFVNREFGVTSAFPERPSSPLDLNYEVVLSRWPVPADR